MDVSGPFISLPILDRVFPQGLDPHDPERSADLRRHYEDWAEEAEDPNVHRSWVLAVLNRTLEIPSQLIVAPSALSKSLDVRVAQHHETLGPDLVIVEPSGRPNAGRPRVLIQIVPRHQDLEKVLEEADWKASPATRITELIRGAGGDGVRLGLLTNGEQWMLVHAPRGETAGYATWQAELWLEEPITLRGFCSLLGVRRLFGVPDGETLEALYTASANDQQEVTDRLGLQVRRAVEILFQAIDRIDQDRNRQLLEGFDEKQLYSATLTVMMRLVFLLYAEEQKLLPIEDPFYAQHYAASTLLEQLQEDEDRLGEQVLERRHAAWNRLLATFRAVHGGIEHESLRLPAYGGGLFDPDRYPFLEGRAVDSKWREVSAQPLRISDSTVLDLLRSIQFLEVQGLSGGGAEAQHLSFKALGVEQIGHVYESLLDHTAVRAESAVIGLAGPREPEVALTELEQYRKKGHDALLDFLVDRTGKSRNALDNALEYQIESDDNRWLVCCGNDTGLFGRVQPWAGLVREDSQGQPTVIAAGSVYATTGSDRRSTGTYYTPRSLTEPIVQYTLEPLVYRGPAEGKPQEEWVLRSAREILALKVCDMACGSGAFLVQVCRYLSERLAEAWARLEAAQPGMVVVTPEGDVSAARPSECVIPRDPDERIAVARRLVADRCLYGVDANPMAVEMAKLSIWLVTLEKNRPFTFLDHAIKCGDSLLGITSVDQIKNFSLDTDDPRRYFGVAEACEQALSESERLRRDLESLPILDLRDAEHKALLLKQADDAVAVLRTIGDVLIGEALATTQSRREGHSHLAEVPQLLQDVVNVKAPSGVRTAGHSRLRNIAVAILQPPKAPIRRPFHWPLEFPEVFGSQVGFDAFVGNPPFQGGQKITGALGTDYRDYLVEKLAEGKRGSADLCAYFFLRVGSLLRPSGGAGLLATNTIAQGDTRDVGLDTLTNRGVCITRAVPSRPWPGGAALEVAHIWVRKGGWIRPFVLDDREVSGIGPMLAIPGRAVGKPHRLAANAGKSFQGSIVLGMGFVLEPEDATALVKINKRNKDVLSLYLNGEDLNSRPDQSASRWVINFREWPLNRKTAPNGYKGPVAADYSECLEIVRSKVKPERDRNNRKVYRDYWWQYGEKRPALYDAIAGLEHVTAICLVTQHVCFARVPNHQVFAHRLAIFPFEEPDVLALLQSTLYEPWARDYSSSLETRLNFSPSDCFETFPFPPTNALGGLRSIGARYETHRSKIMASRQEGLTRIYNRFHDTRNDETDIRRLRDLHIELDVAVAKAYGWGDLSLDHDFYDTKAGRRFTLSPIVRREVLDRLLELNHARYAEELSKGLHSKGRRLARSTNSNKGNTLFGA